MLSSGIIVFREVLEAALVIGIVLVATKGVVGRNLWIGGGILGGLIGATIVAFSTEAITMSLEGMGQEVLNAAILYIAAAVIGWSVVWMKSHGRQLAAQMNEVGRGVSEGELPMHMLSLVVGLAVLREGAETVLFLYGISAVPGAQGSMMLSGGLLGLVAGMAIGVMMYLGLLRISSKHLFTVTSLLLAFLAAGMASQATGFLISVGQLPALVEGVWDSSALLSEQSLIGEFLHVLIGYESRPAGSQLVVYGLTLAAIYGFIRLGEKRQVAKAALAVAVAIVTLTGLPNTASATHKVYSPIVEGGEFGIEWRGHVDIDEDGNTNGNQRQIYEIEYGFTDRLMIGLLGDARSTATKDFYYRATGVEVIYQLFEQGEYWLDAGLYGEFKKAHRDEDASKVEAKLLLEKSTTSFSNTLNLIFEKEVGDIQKKSTEFQYAWRSQYRYSSKLMPGFEVWGKPGRFNDMKAFNEQTLQIGPAIYGKLPAEALGGKFAYELGYLFGTTDPSPDGTFKWLLEYETYF